MYVWKNRGRRDRRHYASTGLDTLDPADLALLQKKEKKFRADEEIKRYELEQIEIDKHVKYAHDDLQTYFETRNGKDEVSAVGAVLMDIRAEEERIKKEKAKASGEDVDDDDSEFTALTDKCVKERRGSFHHTHTKRSLDQKNRFEAEVWKAKEAMELVKEYKTTMQEFAAKPTSSKALKKKVKDQKEGLKKLTGCSDEDLEVLAKEPLEGTEPPPQTEEEYKAEKKKKKEEAKEKAEKDMMKAQHFKKVSEKASKGSPGKEPLDPMSIEAIQQMDPADMNKEQKMKMKVFQVFSMFDADASSTINHEEMRNCIDELCIPMDEDELTQVMKEVDDDGSGEVEFEEFYTWYKENAEGAKKGKTMKGMALKFAQAMRNYNGESIREEAKRLILAQAERSAIERSRKIFRLSRPPRFSCEVCGESFKNTIDEGVHKANGKMIHKKWRDEVDATLKRQQPVLDIIDGEEARKWRVRRLIHSQHLYDPERDGITYDDITVWNDKSRPFMSDPSDKRGEQLRKGMLVEGYDAKIGKRPGFVQRGFVLRDNRPGEGRTRNHMACNPLLLQDVILRLYLDKKPWITKSVKKRCKKHKLALPLDTISNTFVADPAGGQSKALCSFIWSGLVYQGAFVHAEFNGYRGERMESQGHVNKDGVSEFGLEKWLSPGVYFYYFLIDGRNRIDKTKPTIVKNGEKRNIVTVCNPSILGAQGGPYTDGRFNSKNFDAVASRGGDVSTLVENSNVDMVSKIKRSRQGNRQHGMSRDGWAEGSIANRPSSTDGQHRLNAIMTPSNDGMSAKFDLKGGKAMTEILLVHNMVCDDGSWALSQALIDNHRVKEIDLSTNLITSDGLNSLSGMMEKNSTITSLKMNDNSIGYDGCRALSHAFIMNDGLRLRELEFANNSMGDDGVEALCEGVKGCGTLTYLNLDRCRIHDDGAKAIGKMLMANKILTRLNLNFNRIGAAGARAIGESLYCNVSLRTLGLNSNPLGSGGLEAIGKMLRCNDTVTKVTMAYSGVLNRTKGGNGLFVLNQALRVNRSLTSLDLSGNDFSEGDLRNLLISLHHLDNQVVSTRKRNTAIFELNMGDNRFNGDWLLRDKDVNFSGFDKLPSILLYCEQNKKLWREANDEKRTEWTHWLQMKRIKRKQADQRRKDRKTALEARVRTQKALLNPIGVEEGEKEKAEREKFETLSKMQEDKAKKKALKRAGVIQRDGGELSLGGIQGLSKEERDRLMSREAKIGRRPATIQDDDMSISSLGSHDYLKGNMIIGDGMGLEEGSVVSSVTGGGSIITGWGGGSSLGEEGSWKAPSIDSDFLMSLKGSLFGSSLGGDDNGENSMGGGEEEKDAFYKSGMFDIAESEEDTLGASLMTMTLASSDSSSTGLGDGSLGSIADGSFSKNSAASWLVGKAAAEGGGESRTESRSVTFGRPPLPLANMLMPGDVPGSAGFNRDGGLAKHSKLYAREEGEWRKDRTWISQRALDRTARRIAEEKARQIQIERQREEDKHIAERVTDKEDGMVKYFIMDDGKAMINAVVEELSDLRKEEKERVEQELFDIKRRDLVEGTDKHPREKLRVEVKMAFDIFDGDASGQIGVDEFGDLLKELCLPMDKKEVKSLVKRLDDDGSGELDFEEFFAWYNDNFKQQKSASLVGQLKLQAQSYVNASLGTTAKMEAKRILVSNETKDVIALARHDFRTKRKPQFECMECHQAFIDKKTKRLHDKNVVDIHKQHTLLHARATARHKLVDMARFRVTKGEAYPKYFVYHPDVLDHIEQQILDRPSLDTGRPLGIINHNTTIKAIKRSGEKGTGDWLQIVYKNFEEAWIQEKSRRPLRIHLVPMGLGEDSDEIKEEKRRLKIALTGKTEEQYNKENAKEEGEKGEEKKEEGGGGEEEEEEEEEEGVIGEEGKKKKKKKKKKGGEAKEKEKKDTGPVWPKKGHLEFFPIPRYYSISPRLCEGGIGRELNVRAQPDLDSPILGFIIPTECVRCEAMYGDWLQVKFKTYDSGWMLIRNKVHELMKPVAREISERAEASKASPWDKTYDYILNKTTEFHITAGSRDAMGIKAHEKKLEESVSHSTKAQMGLQDQLTEEMA